MNRTYQKLYGTAAFLLGAALLLVPMVLLGEKPGTWLIGAGAGAVAVGLALVLPVQMKHIAQMAGRMLPFLDAEGEA